jgi:hypothetical protein
VPATKTRRSVFRPHERKIDVAVRHQCLKLRQTSRLRSSRLLSMRWIVAIYLSNFKDCEEVPTVERNLGVNKFRKFSVASPHWLGTKT